MAIQIPNAGTGNGATGDNEFVLWTKVINNFSDQTNAASRLVGTAAEQVPLSKNIPSLLGTAATKNVGKGTGQVPLVENINEVIAEGFRQKTTGTAEDTNKIGTKERLYITPAMSTTPLPTGVVGGRLWQEAIGSGIYHQYLTEYSGKGTWTRVVFASQAELIAGTKTFGDWIPMSANSDNYATTTASGANVVVDTTGKLLRSTSSERYKDIIAPLELDDTRYADAMALKPIVYRSTADADNPAYHFYSFSAEELGAYDPAFTLWRETETITDADGNVTEQPLAERQAEGININALLAMSHAIAIKQGDLIKDLQEQINALKPQPEV